MFFSLGDNIFTVFESLLNPKINPQMTHMSANRRNISERRYMIIDLVEWLNNLKSKSLKSFGNSQELLTLYQNHKIFLTHLKNRTVDSEMLSSHLLSNTILDPSKMQEVLYMYTLFMEDMFNLQVEFLKVYTINNATIPILLFPFSYSLNRLERPLLSIDREDRTEAPSSNYQLTLNNFTDLVTRIQIESGMTYPTAYYHTPVSRNTDPQWLVNTLPASWQEPASNIRPGLESYQQRLILLHECYSQYMFYGFKEIDPQATHNQPPTMLLNYPFLCDDSAKQKYNIKLTPSNSYQLSELEPNHQIQQQSESVPESFSDIYNNPYQVS